MSIRTLVRVSASENSFIFVDATSETPLSIASGFGFDSIGEFVRSWTMASRGLSADGLVFVVNTDSNDANYKWDFYNCDGSSAEMCGNAARAMHLYVTEFLNFKQKTLNFGTLSGLVSTEMLLQNIVKVEMPQWKIIKDNISTLVDFIQVEAVLLNTGVPHFVIEVNNIKDEELILSLAKTFRFYDVAGPKGTNVTFYQQKKENKILAVTFERGVEGFTKSCGTGAVAAAIACLLKNNRVEKSMSSQGVQQSEQQVEICVPGGELKVIVNFKKQSAYLIGEAQINYEIHLRT
jgi:diaminopimelate epimerase